MQDCSRPKLGPLEFESLSGLVSYEDARRIQLELVEKRALDQVPDTILFLEHQPVITRGRGLQWTGSRTGVRQMPLPAVLPEGVAYSTSERGGDLTYHGPGQLVIYPICKLGGDGLTPTRDLGGYLRLLEKLTIAAIQRIVESPTGSPEALDLGIRSNATGVWIGERKVASIGIAVRKWVTYHGVAINCVNDLSPFHSFSPCGFSSEVMTRLSDWVEGLEPENWRQTVESSLRGEFLNP